LVFENGEIGEIIGGRRQGRDERVFSVRHGNDVIPLEYGNSIGKKTGGNASQERETDGREPLSLDAGRATRAHDMTSAIARFVRISVRDTKKKTTTPIIGLTV